MKIRIITILIALLISINIFSNPFASNPQRARNPFAEQRTEQNSPQTQNQEPANVESVKPGLMKRIWLWFVSVQKSVNTFLSTNIRKLQENFSFLVFLIIVGASIFYGAFHSLGPGHGKMIVSSYFFNEQASIKDLFIFSVVLSITHNFVALIIAFIIASLTNVDILAKQESARQLTMLISGILLIGIGIFFFIRGFRNKRKKQTANAQNSTKTGKANVFTLGISAGIVPCPLSIAVVFFGIYLKAYTVVIVSVIGMSIGMGLTEFLIGYASMKMRNGVFKVFKNKEKITRFLENSLEYLGATLIIIFGIFILASSFA